MSAHQKPLADECSLCGLGQYDFHISVADEPIGGEYRWAHVPCLADHGAEVTAWYRREVRNSSDEPRADGGQVQKTTDGIERIAPSELAPSEVHVRGTHDPPGEQLVQSIANIGIITPPIGRWENGKVRLIDGVRRARAAAEAGVESIPVVVRDLDDAEGRCQSLTLNDSEAGVRKTVADEDRDQSLNRLADLSGASRESAENEIGMLSDADLIESELAQVPGVGRATAERIAKHYSYEDLVEPPDGYENGVWTPTAPLTNIDGIGEQTARAIRRELYGGGER